MSLDDWILHDVPQELYSRFSTEIEALPSPQSLKTADILSYLVTLYRIDK
jgi:hypothetical protein